MFTVGALLLGKPPTAGIVTTYVDDTTVLTTQIMEPSPDLLGALVCDIIAGLGITLAGALAAGGLYVLDTPGATFAMIGVGTFELSPILLGLMIAQKKDNQLVDALAALRIVPPLR